MRNVAVRKFACESGYTEDAICSKILDGTLIAAPPSIKNREGKRDPEMHQAKKGNQ